MIAELSILFVASAVLAIGPAVGASGRAGPRLAATNDGFTIALVTALCAVLVLPHVVTELGFAGAGLLVLGMAVPPVLRRLHVRLAWSAGLVLALVAVHAAIDGAVLSLGAEHGSGALPWAVIAHRLPFGFALFAWAVQSTSTQETARQAAWVATAMLIVSTILGFAVGSAALAQLPDYGPVATEALVAGALLAVVLSPRLADDHHHHDTTCHDAHHHERAQCTDKPVVGHDAAWAGVGAIAGLALLLVAVSAGELGAGNELLLRAAGTLWALVLETSPALVLGFCLAGIVPFFLTGSALARLERGGRLAQAARGVGYGLPLPVCSCGVLPVYQSLVRRGAPPAAALAFFVATPELGLDAVLLSVPLLGLPLTGARIVAAIIVALLVAILVNVKPSATSEPAAAEPPMQRAASWPLRLRDGLRFGFVEVFDHTMPWIAVGLAIAALGEPLLNEGTLQTIPPALQVPLAVMFGIPMYVCASGATPIAALAIHKGLSGGAAIAFLIAGPATNVTTFGVLARLHGRRMAIAFGLTVSLLAVLVGWTVDLIGLQATSTAIVHEPTETSASALEVGCATILIVVMLASLLRQGPRGLLGQIVSPIHAH